MDEKNLLLINEMSWKELNPDLQYKSPPPFQNVSIPSQMYPFSTVSDIIFVNNRNKTDS